MKYFIISLLFIITTYNAADAQMNVGSNTAPDNSAMLQISGNTKGFLPPRLTQSEMNAIANAAKGLIVFNTTDSLLYMRRDTGWVALNVNGNAWSLAGNENINSGTNFLGNKDLKSLRFRTNNVERMVIDSLGRMGIGITNPTTQVVIKDTLEIRRTGSLSQLLFTNTAGSGDFRIAGDGGDIFWQGGGYRALQMGSYFATVLAGDRLTGTFPPFIGSTTYSGIGVVVQGQRDASIPLAIQANSATQTANLTNWRNSAGGVLTSINKNGYLGIGTAAPATPLHVVGANPLTLLGVTAGTNTSADSLLTITSGLVRKLPLSTFANASNVIASLNGLTATTQTFATGTSGSDFNIVSSGTTHTFNLPDASFTERGLLTTTAQNIAGQKVFSSAPAFSSFTAGSVPYIGSGGLLSENDVSFVWDYNNSRLGIGTNAPSSDFTINQSGGSTINARGMRFTGSSIAGANGGTGFQITLGYNQTNNKQLWLGDADYLGTAGGIFTRYSSTGGLTLVDGINGNNSSRAPLLLGVGSDPKSSIILGADFTNANPSASYVWANNNMAIGTGYRNAAAPANGLLVQGKVSIGQSINSAVLHLKAGTATATTAPLKFTAGTNLTTAENGAVEYDGTNYYGTSGGVRYVLTRSLTASGSLTFGSTGGGASSTTTINVAGAAVGDAVSLGLQGTFTTIAGVFLAYVSATNIVTVRYYNPSGGAITPGTGTVRVSVIHY